MLQRPHLPDAALHPVLEGRVDLRWREAELLEDRHRVLDHDRRAADEGEPVLRRRARTVRARSARSRSSPSSRAFRRRDRPWSPARRRSAPPTRLQLVLVDEVRHGARAVDDPHLAELLARVEDVPDQAAQRRQGDAADDEQQVLAVELLQREGVAVRAAEADDVPRLLLATGPRSPCRRRGRCTRCGPSRSAARRCRRSTRPRRRPSRGRTGRRGR